MEPEPRAYTEEEIRTRFLDQVRANVDYWDGPSVKDRTQKERLEGLAFSILAMLDGGSCGFPACKVMADPHPNDRQFHIDEGENYYPEGMDIAGNLHNEFYGEASV